MRFLTLISMLALLSLFAGCDVVGFENPAGVAAPSSAEKLAGNWHNQESFFTVQHVGEDRIAAAWVEMRDGEFKLHEISGMVRQVDGHDVLHLQFEHDDKSYWSLGWIIIQDRQAVLYPIDVATVTALVENQTLQGTVTRKDRSVTVLVASPSAALTEAIERHWMRFWVVEEPVVFTRLK